MSKHYITIANGKKIGIHEYCEVIKLAKVHPNNEFSYGIITWWPVTDAEIMQQFRDNIHDRINNRETRRV